MARLPRGRVRVVGAEEALAICHHALLEGAGVRQRHGLSIRRFHSGFRSPLPHMPHNLSTTAASVNCVRTQSRGGSMGRPDEYFRLTRIYWLFGFQQGVMVASGAQLGRPA